MSRLPDFVIIGAQKGGTTAAMSLLTQHPEIAANDRFYVKHRRDGSKLSAMLAKRVLVEEPHFFTFRWNRGLRWYQGLFTSDAPIVGEKTPAILHDPVAMQRMKDVLPNAKAIAILREPVARAYSQFNHYNQIPEQSVRWGWRPGESFAEALEADRDGILSRSLYAEHLARLFDLYPRHQVFVGISERIRANPQDEFAALYTFLGAAPFEVRPISSSRAHIRPYRDRLDPDERSAWLETFRPHNRRLFELLGYEIPEWS